MRFPVELLPTPVPPISTNLEGNSKSSRPVKQTTRVFETFHIHFFYLEFSRALKINYGEKIVFDADLTFDPKISQSLNCVQHNVTYHYLVGQNAQVYPVT